MFFSKNSEKGRHVFRLRHGDQIEGRTHQNRAQTDQKTFRNQPRKKVPQQMLKSVDFCRFWDPFWNQKVLQIRKQTCQEKSRKKVQKRTEKSKTTRSSTGYAKPALLKSCYQFGDSSWTWL